MITVGDTIRSLLLNMQPSDRLNIALKHRSILHRQMQHIQTTKGWYFVTYTERKTQEVIVTRVQ